MSHKAKSLGMQDMSACLLSALEAFCSPVNLIKESEKLHANIALSGRELQMEDLHV